MVLRSRAHMEMYCPQPIIVDFLMRRFTHGLHSLAGTGGLPTEKEKFHDLAHGAANCAQLVLDVKDKVLGLPS